VEKNSNIMVLGGGEEGKNHVGGLQGWMWFTPGGLSGCLFSPDRKGGNISKIRRTKGEEKNDVHDNYTFVRKLPSVKIPKKGGEDSTATIKGGRGDVSGKKKKKKRPGRSARPMLVKAVSRLKRLGGDNKHLDGGGKFRRGKHDRRVKTEKFSGLGRGPRW